MRSSSTARASRSILPSALLVGLGAALLAACSPHDAPTGADAPGALGTASSSARVGAPSITSRDSDGAPKFLWADRSVATAPIAGDLSAIARGHLARHAKVLGLSQHLVDTAQLATKHELPGGGSVVSFRQRLNGIAVFSTRAAVVMDRTNNLVAITGNLRSAADAPSKLGRVGRFVLTPESALLRAYADRFGVTLPSGAVTDAGTDADGEWHAYHLATPAGAARILDTARVRKVYLPQKGRLVAAYHTEFIARPFGKRKNDAWLHAIAADDGRTLVRKSLTLNDKFTYRVWTSADQHNIPTDSPLADHTPLPASATPANTKESAFILPGLVTIDGFNTNPGGTADPWLAPAATETKGNNVDAYTDRDSVDGTATDGFNTGDLRADVTSSHTFDRTYNTALAPNASPDQEKASVTQIFYETNWLHDYWYDSGFDEASGNGQASNYGRGGKEGDPLLAEAQDGADEGQSNNANMDAMSDGMSPRMQMYVWDGKSTLSVVATPSAGFTDAPSNAPFGATVYDVTNPAVVSSPADACAAPTNVNGSIAIVDRGTCDFATKAKNCQDAGATAIVIINNAAGHVATSIGGDGTGVTIPVIGLSNEDGALLKAKIAAGAVSVEVKRSQETQRDGTIDDTVVAHEWGHYLHLRLEDCSDDLDAQCSGMSEGWADFDALMMVIKGGDDLTNTAYPLATYATVALSDSASYFGIRRAPYSSDMTKNAFTFQDIRASQVLPTTAPTNDADGDNSEVHNVGEIWAESLFEGYTNMLRDTQGAAPRFTFDQAKRRMADIVVAGMKATPSDPTFTEQRDALLAVAFARDQKDFTELATGFAKRGLGVGAVAPPVESTGLDEAVEDFSFKGELAYLGSTVDDAVRSCDRDGVLDADEKGDVTIQIKNAGWLNLANTTATVTTTAAGVTLGNGGVATALSLDPFGVLKVRVPIAYDASMTKQALVPITITLANPASFDKTVVGKIEPRVNFDVKDGSSASDDVESPLDNPKTPWTFAHLLAGNPAAWDREAKTDANGVALDPPDYEWVGADLGSLSDESLVSPPLVVSATTPFTIAFTHKYSFESGPVDGKKGSPTAYFDGGVIEITTDGGATWVDISTYANPGYTQTINRDSDQETPPDTSTDNPLSGRKAYAGSLATYTPVTLDLGTALAGKTVQIRFRVGTDEGTGDSGWEIDDFAFTGITNTPFATLIDDASVCNGVPIVVPGAPQTVQSGAKVTLDASGSTSPLNLPITFAWEELDGVAVTLNDPTTNAVTGFTAPTVTAPTPLLFRVTVADPHQAASDTVLITVVPPGTAIDAGDLGSPGTPATSGDDGCGCTTVGASHRTPLGALAAALMGAVALLRARRRRR